MSYTVLVTAVRFLATIRSKPQQIRAPFCYLLGNIEMALKMEPFRYGGKKLKKSGKWIMKFVCAMDF